MGQAAAWGRRVTSSDDELICGSLEGRVDDFGELYRRHSALVHGFLCRCTGNREEAEDLTQEVFVLAWRKLSQYEKRSAFSTWLISIAVAQFRSRRRSGRSREQRQAAWLAESTARTDDAPPPELVIDLERAINGLPERARLVLILHEINGLLHEEIATMLGITVGASKAHLYRARRILRRRLDR
jgi:RNA polymerase sigma-70 factor (ECF subfamily)